MNYKYDVSIVIVNYNGKRYLFDLFSSLMKMDTTGIDFEVVFVDNNSSDDSIQYLENSEWKQKLNLKIVKNSDNQGFAKGNNTGVLHSEGKYVVFLNNDTAVEREWLITLYDYISNHDNYGIIASKLIFFHDFINVNFFTKDKVIISKKVKLNGTDYVIENKYCKNLLYQENIVCFGNTEISLPLLNQGDDFQLEIELEQYNEQTDYIIVSGKKIVINNSHLEISLDKEEVESGKYQLIQNAGSGINENFDGYDIGMGEHDSTEYNEKKELMAGCGAAIILLREDFLNVGMFDERLFMYYEDTDLSFRIRKTGKKIMFCPTSVVRHVHTGSSGEWSPFFSYHVFRNKLIFIYKNVSKKTFWKIFIPNFLRSIKHRDKIRENAFWDALLIAIFNKKNVTYKG